MRRALLAVTAILCGFMFPTVYETNLDRPVETARALPSLSGAIAAQVPNGDFSGTGLGEVGTPPANHDFETPGGPVGTPPANHDFATGDLTGWTPTGFPTVQSGGPSGNYVAIRSGQMVQSSAFTVASDAQVLTLKVAQSGSGTLQIQVVIYYGTNYASSSTQYLECVSSCASWNTHQINAMPYQGQSIMVRVGRFLGDFDLTDVAVGVETLTSWAPAEGHKVSRGTGGPDGAYARASTAIASQAYTIDANGQNGQVDVKVEGASGTYDVYVLSGPAFATSTKV